MEEIWPFTNSSKIWRAMVGNQIKVLQMYISSYYPNTLFFFYLHCKETNDEKGLEQSEVHDPLYSYRCKYSTVSEKCFR